MNLRQTISQELSSLNSDMLLNQIQSPYSVPDGYFETFAASMLNRIRNSATVETAQISSLVAGISKTMPFEVPSGYFDENIDALPSLIGEDISSPVLSYIGKELPFEVPAGYFENQAEQATAKLRPGAKVIRLGVKRLMRVAVAAVLTGVMAIAGYNYFSGGTVDPVASDNKTTATLPDVEKELKTIPTKELDAFIKNVDVNLNNSIVSNTSTGTDDVRDMLKDVSVAEMDNFLQEVSASDEELLVID